VTVEPATTPAAAHACDDCLRSAWLVARLAGRIEIARHDEKRLPEVLALGDAELIAALGGDEAPRLREAWRAFDPDAARTAVAAAGLDAVCRHDGRYPGRLRDAADAPRTLFCGGAASGLEALADGSPTVGIVGTRRASRDGLAVARAIGRDLAVAGVPVISGMALGIDAAAQTGALDAGGLSVAVLAGGADVAYPRSKRALHRRLLDDGLVVSEAPPGSRVWKWAFPARNRIIAALADLTVVIEAAERSGSLITGRPGAAPRPRGRSGPGPRDLAAVRRHERAAQGRRHARARRAGRARRALRRRRGAPRTRARGRPARAAPAPRPRRGRRGPRHAGRARRAHRHAGRGRVRRPRRARAPRPRRQPARRPLRGGVVSVSTDGRLAAGIAPSDEVGFVLQMAGVGALVGTALAARRRMRDAAADTFFPPAMWALLFAIATAAFVLVRRLSSGA
jgi:DNA protecting protein DprA